MAHRSLGRVEAALNAALGERHDIRAAERAALRAQARAVDTAEAAGAVELVTAANKVYLELREAAGLTAAGTKPADAFDDVLRALASPAGASDLPDH